MARPGLDRFLDRDVIVGIRPSSFEDAALAGRNGAPTMKVTVDVTEQLGSEDNVIFTVDAPPAQHESQQLKMAMEVSREEAEVHARTVGEGQSLWTARVTPRTSARPGRQLELAVDNTELYFFDPDSGDAIG
jgi:multiple sugar transport system ATP-binding protein